MNLLKSVFISSYMMLIMSVTGYSGWMLYQGENRLAWSGVFLTTVPMILVFSQLMILKNRARTSAHLPLPNFLGATGVILAGWAFLNQ